MSSTQRSSRARLRGGRENAEPTNASQPPSSFSSSTSSSPRGTPANDMLRADRYRQQPASAATSTSLPSSSTSSSPPIRSNPSSRQSQSLLVKLKMPPPPRTRLMDSAESAATSNPTQPLSTAGSSRQGRNIFAEPVILSGPRNSRNKRPIVEVDSDEEDDDGDDDVGEEDEDATGEYVEEEGEDEEDADGDADVDMDDAPPVSSTGKNGRQILKLTNTRGSTNAAGNAHASTGGKTVAQPAGKSNKKRYTEDTDSGKSDEEDDDDGLSSIGSDEVEREENDEEEDNEDSEEDEEEEEEEEEEVDDEVADATAADDDEANEIDAEGEIDDAATPAAAASSSEESDDEDDEAISTDPSRMTKRQRGNLGTDFLQLPMEPQIKKHLTAEEHAMRRAEMARRRKNLSEKRNEEEKMDVINKLLRKQAPRKRGRVSTMSITAGGATAAAGAVAEDEKAELAEAEQTMRKEAPPQPNMVRYVWRQDGCRLGVPQEWVDAGVGGCATTGHGKRLRSR